MFIGFIDCDDKQIIFNTNAIESICDSTIMTSTKYGITNIGAKVLKFSSGKEWAFIDKEIINELELSITNINAYKTTITEYEYMFSMTKLEYIIRCLKEHDIIFTLTNF